MLVFDITSKYSFENLDRWFNEIKRFTDEQLRIILVGNKSDLSDKREVTQKDAIAYASKKHIPYFETSALESINVNEAFEDLLVSIAKKNDPYFESMIEKPEINTTSAIKLLQARKSKKKCC